MPPVGFLWSSRLDYEPTDITQYAELRQALWKLNKLWEHGMKNLFINYTKNKTRQKQNEALFYIKCLK